MKKNRLRNGLIFIGILVVLLTRYNKDYEYSPNYEIVEEVGHEFAKYSEGKVFIGTKRELIGLIDEIGENDIVVIDQRRNNSDPNMRIVDSYKVKDKEIRNEILEIICKYEEKYPTVWDRTIETMRLEWYMHNVSFLLNHQIDRTGDVDLDNDDEEYYNIKLLNKILRL